MGVLRKIVGRDIGASAWSILAFGVYMIVVGSIYCYDPNIILVSSGFDATHEIWIRLLGMVLCIFGCYYVVFAVTETRIFFWMSIFGRLSVPFFNAGFVMAGLVPAAFMLLAVNDVIGAVWTAAAMWWENRNKRNTDQPLPATSAANMS